MRWSRALLLLAGGLAACRFSVAPVDFGAGGGNDLAPLGNNDLAPSNHGDLGGAVDMACSAAGCPFGCSATPTPHCRGLQPSGVVTVADYSDPALAMQTATGNVVIHTDDGSITGGITRAAGSGVLNGIGFRAAAQINGPTVGVFGVAGFSLPAGSKITFVGGNAFALASRGNVTLSGAVDGSCSLGTVGPGGSLGGTSLIAAGFGGGLGGGAGGASAKNGASGGGGGGFGDIGGTGAQGMGLALATASGPIWGNITPSGALVLVGGSGGGAGGVDTSPGGGGPGPGVPMNDGGGGGGAIQLSVDGALTLAGTLSVGGCGGRSGISSGGGGGGGSGGAIVLEAGSISITSAAILTANGGGGGGGDTGGPGADGAASSVPAPGGATGDNGGNGGSGGARGAQAGLHNTEGGNAPLVPMLNYGGGGGGGAGRILFRSLTTPSDQASVISPDPSDINNKGQRMTTFDSAVFQ